MGGGYRGRSNTQMGDEQMRVTGMGDAGMRG
jgi:hypothetical protein